MILFALKEGQWSHSMGTLGEGRKEGKGEGEGVGGSVFPFSSAFIFFEGWSCRLHTFSLVCAPALWHPNLVCTDCTSCLPKGNSHVTPLFQKAILGLLKQRTTTPPPPPPPYSFLIPFLPFLPFPLLLPLPLFLLSSLPPPPSFFLMTITQSNYHSDISTSDRSLT